MAARTPSAREANATLTASIQELLAGFRVLRFFGRGSAATGVIEKFSQTFADRNLSATRLRLGLPPLYSTLMMSGVLFVIWRGERVVGAMSVGAFIAYLTLFIRFVERASASPTRQFHPDRRCRLRAVGPLRIPAYCGERAGSHLSSPVTSPEPPGEIPGTNEHGSTGRRATLKDVTFTSRGRPGRARRFLA